MAKLSKTAIQVQHDVEAALINKYGVVKDEWKFLLVMLATEVDLFLQCSDNINKTGLMVQNKYSQFVANPFIKLRDGAINQIKNIMSELLITPKELRKIDSEIAKGDEQSQVLKELFA